MQFAIKANNVQKSSKSRLFCAGAGAFYQSENRKKSTRWVDLHAPIKCKIRFSSFIVCGGRFHAQLRWCECFVVVSNVEFYRKYNRFNQMSVHIFRDLWLHSDHLNRMKRSKTVCFRRNTWIGEIKQKRISIQWFLLILQNNLQIWCSHSRSTFPLSSSSWQRHCVN